MPQIIIEIGFNAENIKIVKICFSFVFLENPLYWPERRRCSRTSRQAFDWQRRQWTAIFIIIFFSFFFFFSSVVYFSHRRSALIKKLIQQKWLEMANNLGFDPFPDPVGHFGAPWWPFWISRPLIGRNTRSARIKKLIQRKWLGMANNLGLHPFPDHVGHFWALWQPFCRGHSLTMLDILTTSAMFLDNLFLTTYWHERRRCSRSPLGGRLATTQWPLFLPLFSSYFYSPVWFPLL